MPRPTDQHDYIILGAKTSEELRFQVRTALREGWRLAGGVAVGAFVADTDGDGKDTVGIGYYQALSAS